MHAAHSNAKKGSGSPLRLACRNGHPGGQPELPAAPLEKRNASASPRSLGGIYTTFGPALVPVIFGAMSPAVRVTCFGALGILLYSLRPGEDGGSRGDFLANRGRARLKPKRRMDEMGHRTIHPNLCLASRNTYSRSTLGDLEKITEQLEWWAPLLSFCSPALGRGGQNDKKCKNKTPSDVSGRLPGPL